jgi:hypothetical protein
LGTRETDKTSEGLQELDGPREQFIGVAGAGHAFKFFPNVVDLLQIACTVKSLLIDDLVVEKPVRPYQHGFIRKYERHLVPALGLFYPQSGNGFRFIELLGDKISHGMRHAVRDANESPPLAERLEVMREHVIDSFEFGGVKHAFVCLSHPAGRGTVAEPPRPAGCVFYL